VPIDQAVDIVQLKRLSDNMLISGSIRHPQVGVRLEPPCLILIHASCWGRALPAGEGGCAAGSLPPSHYLKLEPSKEAASLRTKRGTC
jgi:hypothetical protein